MGKLVCCNDHYTFSTKVGMQLQYNTSLILFTEVSQMDLNWAKPLEGNLLILQFAADLFRTLPFVLPMHGSGFLCVLKCPKMKFVEWDGLFYLWNTVLTDSTSSNFLNSSIPFPVLILYEFHRWGCWDGHRVTSPQPAAFCIPLGGGFCYKTLASSPTLERKCDYGGRGPYCCCTIQETPA